MKNCHLIIFQLLLSSWCSLLFISTSLSLSFDVLAFHKLISPLQHVLQYKHRAGCGYKLQKQCYSFSVDFLFTFLFITIHSISQSCKQSHNLREVKKYESRRQESSNLTHISRQYLGMETICFSSLLILAPWGCLWKPHFLATHTGGNFNLLQRCFHSDVDSKVTFHMYQTSHSVVIHHLTASNGGMLYFQCLRKLCLGDILMSAPKNPMTTKVVIRIGKG